MARASNVIVLVTSDSAECEVDKDVLTWSSKVFAELLNSCDTGRLNFDETKENLDALLRVIKGCPLDDTFNTRSSVCWSIYKRILTVADKYDMPLVKERIEKWLVSRCLRGKVRCKDYKFQDVNTGLEWVLLCQKYNMKELGWYCAYDLGSQLADGIWRQPVAEFLKEVQDSDFLKVMLEAVRDAVDKQNPAAADAEQQMLEVA